MTKQQRKSIKTKKPRIKWHMVSRRDGAVVVLYRPAKDADYPRGWYVREYHSDDAMRAHLNHIVNGAPPPKHFSEQKGWCWEHSYTDDGPLTQNEAMQTALGLAYIPWKWVPDFLEGMAQREDVAQGH
jgi:hypothetical protein